jgi:hypothetical protein
MLLRHKSFSVGNILKIYSPIILPAVLYGCETSSLTMEEGQRLRKTQAMRWEDNIQRDNQEVGWGGMDWIHLAQEKDRWRSTVNVITNLRVPLNVGNFFPSLGPDSFLSWLTY